tara:strand:+ start:2385 stop:3089 length:705 start_codon:yes stop_codon:yes gene_type:complete
MALILCLETSSKNCSVSISKNGSTLFFQDYFDENYCHGEKLHSLIEKILFENNFSINDFDAFAYSSGPGSYTGLRIGAASVKGFAFALKKPVVAVPTMKSLVCKILNGHKKKYKNKDLFCPVLDSRKGEVYAALYDCNYKEYLAPFACSFASFSFNKYLEKNSIYFFGPGVHKLSSIINHRNAIFLNTDYPSACSLSEIAYSKYKNEDFEDIAYFEPDYLKNFIPTKSKKNIQF